MRVVKLRGVEDLKICLNIRHSKGGQHSGSLGRVRWWRCVLEGIGMDDGGQGRQEVPSDIITWAEPRATHESGSWRVTGHRGV